MRTTIACIASFSLAVIGLAADKAPYHVSGVYTETCACGVPCKCELTGEVPPSCQGVGAFRFTAGDYAGHDLAGVSLAYAVKPGEWVRVYIDAPDQAHRQTAEQFARAAYRDWGKMESVKDARIEIKGSQGTYAVAVDGGRIMSYTTAPILGGDGKTALTLGNTHSVFTSTFLQAQSAGKTMFHDDQRGFELEAGRNAYFNEQMNGHGSL